MDGVGDSVFPLAVSRRNDGGAAVFQGGLHVLEVDIDVAFFRDDVGDASCGVRERIVGFLKGIEEIDVLI